ncbi:MAG: phosphoribosylglycinamide formyltransferase [Limnobacter sp.]|nr:phosphoribosylglycinamide formyltransferase [Limnobacter sp.]
MKKAPPSVVVLISGRGSNLEAIVRHAKTTGEYEVKAVVSNRPNAGGLEFALAHDIPVRVIDHKLFESRDEFDAMLGRQIAELEPDVVALAGFMRILTPSFVARFEGRLLNIHPSLLPAFTGLNTHQQALNAGVRVHGVTVHLVTAELDHGPILDQAVVQVHEGDTAESLANRVLQLEHQIYPRAIARFANQQLKLAGGQIQGAKTMSLFHSLKSP